MREITRTISVSVNGKSMDFRLTKLDAFSGVTLLRLMAKMPEGVDAVYVRVDQNKLWWVRDVEYGDVDIWE